MAKIKRILAYGAGQKAREYLPELMRYCEIDAIWDKNATDGQQLCGKIVTKPDPKTIGTKDTMIIIFIADPYVRSIASRKLDGMGYQHLYGYKTIMELLRTGVNLYDIPEHYKIINSEKPEAVFCLLPKTGGKDTTLALDLELALRSQLDKETHTEYRPIPMSHAGYYDPFAVYEAICRWLDRNEITGNERVWLLCRFCDMSFHNEVVVGAYCRALLAVGDTVKALDLIRATMHRYPNSLFLSTCFEMVSKECKDQGIEVCEPMPDYDLNERFCFSGMNFVLCEGFEDDGTPRMIPCFRGHQCAARPKGEFWTGNEWMEFRKSLMDGSFRYCQKNHCPNLTGGWLPKKKDYDAEWLRRMEKGDYSEAPPIEELHFSYDDHCNLVCGSCRTSKHICSLDKTTYLDERFEKTLRGKLKKAKHLTLSGCGEAVIAPHSRKILQSLSQKDYPELSVELRTNAYSLTPATWKALGIGCEVIRHITVSIDGADKETFEMLRHPAKWEKTLRNLRFIQELRQCREIDFYEFHVVVQEANLYQLTELAEMAAAYGADCVTYSRMVNWSEMPSETYDRMNVFYEDHPLHNELLKEINRLVKYRLECAAKLDRPFYINIHGIPDADETYGIIRSGKLKVR